MTAVRLRGRRHQHGGSRRLASFQICVCLRRLLQWVSLIDLNLHGTVLHDGKQFLTVLFQRVARGHEAGQRRSCQEQRTAVSQFMDGKRRHGTRRIAERDHQTARLQTIQRLFEGRRPNRVVYHRYTATLGEFANAF